MALYDIVKCSHCGELRAVRTGQRSFTCYRCGRRLRVGASQLVARGVEHSRVQEVIAYLKRRG